MSEDDSYGFYVKGHERVRSLKRATDYVYWVIVLLLACGIGVGFVPEWEKHRDRVTHLEGINHRKQALINARNQSREELAWIRDDPEYLELIYRNKGWNIGKPVERLLLPDGSVERAAGPR
ncbi:MAG: hypothetical protein AAF514_18345 [Verrucomicrobiota bacterium]